MISSIRLDGTTACLHLPGAADTAAFVTYIGEVLCPTLRQGDIVVMDNLSSHKGPKIRAAIEAGQARLVYLPPYSPDLNPIEMVFSKIKQTLRGHALRTQNALWSSMQSVLDRVTTSDAANCFRHCGYLLHGD